MKKLTLLAMLALGVWACGETGTSDDRSGVAIETHCRAWCEPETGCDEGQASPVQCLEDCMGSAERDPCFSHVVTYQQCVLAMECADPFEDCEEPQGIANPRGGGAPVCETIENPYARCTCENLYDGGTGGTGGTGGSGGSDGSGGAGGIGGTAGSGDPPFLADCSGGALAAPVANCQPAPLPSSGDPYADCVMRINQLRWECQCLPALQRWNEAEGCADQHSEYDSTRSPHAGFSDDICSPRGWAQNECPGWGSTEHVITGCLKDMWDEGPGEPYSAHGHYINMTNPSYSMVACGFYETPDGQVWSVQNFQ